MENRIRMTAKKIRISDITNGRFFFGSREEMRASYLITPFGEKVSRVNLFGTVAETFLSEDGNYSSVTIDDGTGTVRTKVFGNSANLFKEIEAGNMVVIVGKIKQYNDEIYVNAEIAKKISDPNYENLRKLEIQKNLKKQEKTVGDIRKIIDKMSEEELIDYVKKKYGFDIEQLQTVRDNLRIESEIDFKPKIMKLIETMDKGEGVEIGKIIEIADLPENVIESAINELLGSGMLYEPKAGVLKKV